MIRYTAHQRVRFTLGQYNPPLGEPVVNRIDRAQVPAAHSMDTAWYGVDADGNLALFDTGEAGAMPVGAVGDNDHLGLHGGDHQAFYDIAAAVGATEEHLYGADHLFDGRSWAEIWQGWSGPLFRYEHDDPIAGRYIQRFAPKRPARIEEVPRALRQFIVRLPVRFVKQDVVQPMEHVPCHVYGSVWLSSDGGAVRVVPGEEERAALEWEGARPYLPHATFVRPGDEGQG